MTKNKFYCFKNIGEQSVDLYINGEIVDDETKSFYSWVMEQEAVGYSAPMDFRDRMNEVQGKHINVYIDSVGGDVWAASTIYSMLREHKGGVTVKVTGIAASSASFIAMAGDKVYMSETAIMMIHNPMTVAMGNRSDMEKAIERLDACKETIMNAYERKTGLDREEISALMDAETWFDYKTAMEKGFCDGVIENYNDTVIENRINEYRVWNATKEEEYAKKKAEIEKKREDERLVSDFYTLAAFSALSKK